jgi:hypothetical protein
MPLNEVDAERGDDVQVGGIFDALGDYPRAELARELRDRFEDRLAVKVGV